MPIQLTTEEYWDVDGVPLNTYAYNIASLTGRTATPGLRGEDREQAFRPGLTFLPKVAEARSITLGMWVQGSNPNLVGNQSVNHSAEFRSNLEMLQRLFFSPRKQFTLTKRWRDLDGLHTASAKGQVISPITPVHTKNRATLTVDVFLTDPFFYETTPIVVPVAVGGSATTTNPGVDSSPSFLTVSLIGPLTNPVLKNTTPNPDISLTYSGSIPSGATLSLDVASSRATLSGSLVNNALSFSGSIWPMEVFPGVNNFTLTAASGTGSASISYRPAHF